MRRPRLGPMPRPLLAFGTKIAPESGAILVPKRGVGVGVFTVAAAVVVLAVGGLAGCSGGGAGPGGGAATTSGPVRGGVLRVGMAAPRSLDPLRAQSAAEVVLADLLYDTLTTVDPRTGEVRPGLATRWEAGPGLRSFTFHLRPGARFGDGRPVRAADVVFTLDRARVPGSGLSALVTPALGAVSEVAAPDAGTVVVSLTEPFPDLPAVLAHPALGVVPAGAPAAELADGVPGSGPFAVAERDGGVIRLRRARGSPALLDGVEVHTGDGRTVASTFAAGRLDWALVPAEEAPSLAARTGRAAYAPLAALVFYGINVRSPKLADPRFREAIVRAVDRAAIARGVYRGTVRPVAGPVPQGVPGAVADPCGERCRFDPGRARGLVAEVFPGGPPPVAVDTEDEPVQRAVAGAIAEGLRAVGIEATVRTHSPEEYAALVARGGQEVFRLGWAAGYPSAAAFLRPLFESGSETNVTGFASPAVDAALAAARTTADPAVRLARLEEAQRMVMAAVPIIPIGQFETLAFSAERVRGLRLTVVGSFDGAAVWLAPASSVQASGGKKG